MIDLKGKNALITGASRGIGQQIAQGLAKLGCNVILHARAKDGNAQTLALLKDFDIQTYTVYGELSDQAQVQSVIKQVKDLGVRIDVLFNNAAIMSTYREDYLTHTWDDWMNSMKVNVFALYDLCSAFLPSMLENKFGRIINTSSGIADQPELAPYGASKWAVNKLTDDLAFKVKDTNVRINTLDPGWLRTDLGGPNADHAVDAVLPGALAPALIDNDGPNGTLFSAIEHNLDPNLLK